VKFYFSSLKARELSSCLTLERDRMSRSIYTILHMSLTLFIGTEYRNRYIQFTLYPSDDFFFKQIENFSFCNCPKGEELFSVVEHFSVLMYIINVYQHKN
jgi:hypothetical protein